MGAFSPLSLCEDREHPPVMVEVQYSLIPLGVEFYAPMSSVGRLALPNFVWLKDDAVMTIYA